MDARKGIRKLHGGYVDWYGHPSSKEAYEAQFEERPQDSLPTAVQDELYAELQDPSEAAPVQLEALTGTDGVLFVEINKYDQEWPSYKIAECGIPHQTVLLREGYTELGDLPITEKSLKEIPGIGVKSAHDIADWLDATHARPVA